MAHRDNRHKLNEIIYSMWIKRAEEASELEDEINELKRESSSDEALDKQELRFLLPLIKSGT